MSTCRMARGTRRIIAARPSESNGFEPPPEPRAPLAVRARPLALVRPALPAALALLGGQDRVRCAPRRLRRLVPARSERSPPRARASAEPHGLCRAVAGARAGAARIARSARDAGAHLLGRSG